jgi:hypothetical protein
MSGFVSATCRHAKGAGTGAPNRNGATIMKPLLSSAVLAAALTICLADEATAATVIVKGSAVNGLSDMDTKNTTSSTSQSGGAAVETYYPWRIGAG